MERNTPEAIERAWDRLAHSATFVDLSPRMLKLAKAAVEERMAIDPEDREAIDFCFRDHCAAARTIENIGVLDN